MKYLVLTLMGMATMTNLCAQDKMLTMEDAVLGHHLYPRSSHIQWQGDKNNMTYVRDQQIIGQSVENGEETTLLTVEELNKIIGSDLKGIPPFGWKNAGTLTMTRQGKYYEINVEDKTLQKTVNLPKQAVNLTSNGFYSYAFTRDNNLYYMNEDGHEYAVTKDEDKNIVNGQAVSRSEFGINGGIFWSPDGKRLAFYRKDESEVSTFPLLDINTRTGSLKEIKYPMAGMKSEQVSLGLYDVASGKTVFLDVTDFGREQYLTNITWSPASDVIYVQVVDRKQKYARLNSYDAKTGTFIKTLLEEQHDKFVEPQDKLVFLKSDPAKFLYRTNNRDGYANLYLCDVAGGEVKRLTNTDADEQFVAEDGKYIYYTSAEVSPVDNQLFKVELKSSKKSRLTQAEGWHTVNMSADKKYFIDNYSSLNVPRVINLTKSDGKIVREIMKAEDPTKDYKSGEISLGCLKAADGKTDLYYRLVKPADFDASKKYPVVVYVYGGPHSQLVKNSWHAGTGMWEMYMAQQGYVVFVMDNRGTSNRGQAFENVIHGECGQQEMADQMEGIRFLKSQPWVDTDRMGVHGWSYGGFMAITLITNHPEVFKVAVAGGPVIDWKWYEIMYGERYMDSPLTNVEGYEKTSLINKAKDLKGKLLICQGAIDNVVLWEHSLSFIRECIKNNVQVDYFPYPCAEHNVMGKDRIHLMQKVTNYFEDYLK